LGVVNVSGEQRVWKQWKKNGGRRAEFTGRDDVQLTAGVERIADDRVRIRC